MRKILYFAVAACALAAPAMAAPAGQVDNLPKPAAVNDLGMQVIQERPRAAMDEFSQSQNVARQKVEQHEQQARVETMNQDARTAAPEGAYTR